MQHPLITPTGLNEVLTAPSTLIFDVRHNLKDPEAGQQAYRAGHLPGAHFLHMDRDLSGPIVPGKTGRHPLPDAQEFAVLMSSFGLAPGKQVVVYDDKGGGLAARLWWMLRAIGHGDARVLNGGIPAWETAGFAVEAGDVPLPATDYRRRVKPYDIEGYQLPNRSYQWVRDRGERQTLVDSRTGARFRGEHEPIDPVAGHIPGAVNYPWPDNLDAVGGFKSPEQLRDRFSELGSGAEITFYCGSGVTACHNVLAYEVAFGRVAGLYPGSWSEWIVLD